MDVSIKNFDVGMQIKNKGIELEVRSTANKHIGDLVITKTKLVWCEGRTQRENGVEITWDEFREEMNSR